MTQCQVPKSRVTAVSHSTHLTRVSSDPQFTYFSVFYQNGQVRRLWMGQWIHTCCVSLRSTGPPAPTKCRQVWWPNCSPALGGADRVHRTHRLARTSQVVELSVQGRPNLNVLFWRTTEEDIRH